MNKHFDKFAHVFLYAALVIGAIGVYLSRFNSQRQFTVVLLLVVFYLIWGFAYHHLKGDANKKLMIEYLIIAVIALLASFFVLLI